MIILPEIIIPVKMFIDLVSGMCVRRTRLELCLTNYQGSAGSGSA